MSRGAAWKRVHFPLGFWEFDFQQKRARDVYNITGSDRSNCRILCVFWYEKSTVQISLDSGYLVHFQGLEPWARWLRVSCSTNWARSACEDFSALHRQILFVVVHQSVVIQLNSCSTNWARSACRDFWLKTVNPIWVCALDSGHTTLQLLYQLS